METQTKIIPVVLHGENYFYWSKAAKAVLRSKGLWNHITQSDWIPQTPALPTNPETPAMDNTAERNKWGQDDQLALTILQSSLDEHLLKSFISPEKAKDLWDALQKVYGNLSNLCRVFEIKKKMSNLQQNGKSFNLIHGEFAALWNELDDLQPPSNDIVGFKQRLEEDKIFSILLTLDSSYNDMIYHVLRQDKLPSYDDVCMLMKREEGGHHLFGGPSEIAHYRQNHHLFIQSPLPPSPSFPREKKQYYCDHCKRSGHSKERCWLLNPHLNPTKFKDHAVVRGKANTTDSVTLTPSDMTELKHLLLALKDKETGY
ncbi:PREDICTED: uncharacterized protein LOC104801619 [Tarenaya hassleriana]|uniref:uncharacterized protein LOC104801619 n=1 Tax=Tarenaya hassleriana TaxID=28532 RepID=UPI00053C6100|nr:PREDICTED: uncharacterized protein LOC104801619 [Tarenaya hassleriana]